MPREMLAPLVYRCHVTGVRNGEAVTVRAPYTGSIRLGRRDRYTGDN